MAALHILKGLAVREIHLIGELEERYPYVVIGVDRITVARRRWCILHLQKEENLLKVVIEKDNFTNPEELLIFVGAIESVLIYSGQNSDEKSTCRILCYETTIGQLYEK